MPSKCGAGDAIPNFLHTVSFSPLCSLSTGKLGENGNVMTKALAKPIFGFKFLVQKLSEM
jgi:hypothetical protein